MMTSCKTRSAATQLQSDRQVITSSEAIKNTDVRDNSITDITVIDFDTFPAERSDLVNPVIPPSQNIRRLTFIHRQNNIQSTTNDSISKNERSVQHSSTKSTTSSKPDKFSQSIALTFPLLLILAIILFAIIILRR